MTGAREGVGIECDERVFGVDFFEGVVEEEQAGEVVCVCDERCPDFFGGDGVGRVFVYVGGRIGHGGKEGVG